MFGYIANIGPASLVLILVIALIIFGPGKLPGVGKALGESVHGFKKGICSADSYRYGFKKKRKAKLNK